MEKNPNYRFKQCKIFNCNVHLCTTSARDLVSVQVFHGDRSALTYKTSCYKENEEVSMFSAVRRKQGRKVKGGEREKGSKEVRGKGKQGRQEAKGRRRTR